MTDLSVDTTAYNVLAPEYYDPVCHPTCANFRQASHQIVKPWIEKFADDRPICEVGTGMSITAEVLSENVRSLTNLHLTDSAASMLSYSLGWEARGAKTCIAAASKLPFAGSAFGLCISSLGDPYNTVELWAELARVLSVDGYGVFTTPSYEWATRYRGLESDSSDKFFAEFQLSDGRTVLAPSIIHAQGEQEKLIAATQCLEVVDSQAIRYSDLPTANISPKLIVARNDDLPIVVGYLVRKM